MTTTPTLDLGHPPDPFAGGTHVAPDGWVYQLPLTPPDLARVCRLHHSQHEQLQAEMSLALDHALAGLLMETLQ